MIRHISGLGEVVDDVAAAVAFYRDVLGLEVEYSDGEAYAEVKITGIPHYGLWGRTFAAESIFGDASKVDQVPLGFVMGFEVDAVDEAARAAERRGLTIIQQPKTEPWGQVTSRFTLPSGLIGEFTETPWARQLGE